MREYEFLGVSCRWELWRGLSACSRSRTSNARISSSSLFLSSPELSDTKIYEPQIRALLETASHFCEAVVLKLGAVPFGAVLVGMMATALGFRSPAVAGRWNPSDPV